MMSGILGKKSIAKPDSECRKLVEAAGVEPASENVTGKENYMLSQFMLPVFTGNVRCRALRTDKKRWQLAR